MVIEPVVEAVCQAPIKTVIEPAGRPSPLTVLDDGQLLSGAQAFLAVRAALPGWRWLALAGPGRPPAVRGLVDGVLGPWPGSARSAPLSPTISPTGLAAGNGAARPLVK